MASNSGGQQDRFQVGVVREMASLRWRSGTQLSPEGTYKPPMIGGVRRYWLRVGQVERRGR